MEVALNVATGNFTPYIADGEYWSFAKLFLMAIANSKNVAAFLKTLVITVYFLSLLAIALFAYRRPLYNWDMLAYMALAIQTDHSTAPGIHELTYTLAKENIPEADYAHLVGSVHRKDLAQNADTFFNSLPFYAVKPLYIQLVSIFYTSGFSLPLATVLPSILFYLLIGILLFYWLSKYLPLGWVFAISLLVMFSGFMVFMARLSTPDCMSSFFLLAAFYCITEKPSLEWVIFFLLLSVFTRLDNIIPVLFIFSFLFFSKKCSRNINLLQYLSLLGFFIACYFVITAVSMRPFDWNIFYYPAFARHLDLSHSAHTSFSFQAYLALVVSQLATAVVYYNVILFMLVVLLIIYTRALKYKNLSLDQVFSVLLVLIIFCRFILYPDLSDRFNIAYYLFFLIALVKKCTGLFPAVNTSSEESLH